AIMAVGLALRLQGMGFGAPADRCRWDEQFAVVEAICRVGGDPHLHFHNYPPGLIHAYSVLFRLGAKLGLLHEIDLASFANDPASFYRCGRILSTILGVLTLAA